MTRRALNPDNMTDRNWWSSPRYWAERVIGGISITALFVLIASIDTIIP